MSWLQEVRRDQQAREKSAQLADEERKRERKGQCEIRVDKALGLLPRWRTLKIDQILVDWGHKFWPGNLTELYVVLSVRGLGTPVWALETHRLAMRGWTLRGKRQNLVDDMVGYMAGFADPPSIPSVTGDVFLERSLRERDWDSKSQCYRLHPLDLLTISLYGDQAKVALPFGNMQIPLDETVDARGFRKQITQWLIDRR